MRTKKIFFIGPIPPPIGGVSVHIKRLVREIAKSDEFSCFVFDIGRFRFFDQDLKPQNIFQALRFFFLSSIVHIHVSHKWKVFLAIIAKAFNKKIVYTRHNIRIGDERNEDKLHNLSDLAIYVSKMKSNRLDEKTFVIPAYIHSDSRLPLEDHLLKKVRSHKEVIAVLSSHPTQIPALIDGKDIYGFDLVLEAFDRLPNTDRLLILLEPSGAMREFYSNKISALTAAGKHIVYPTETVDFNSLLEHLTVYVRPTRTDGDSIAIREALSAGVKVLASDCVARPDVSLFRSGDADSLRDNLEILISDPKRKAEIQPDFSKQILELYRNL